MRLTNMILIRGVSSIGYQGHINFVQVTIVLLSDVWSTK